MQDVIEQKWIFDIPTHSSNIEEQIYASFIIRQNLVIRPTWTDFF